ncbi:Amino acid/amide ABC transporter substrate-binding protein, HAAT family [uncultured delta proteobacterium]|uniref:Amino acid/amide ABC transporter substrate-binding protein, HAAT family n=1 Tax=uncultured delta proteobacterium TaxID=34034 RepID=A0A212JUB6_9DELT|nr:Amino acid/amide ABC transporter substrate-binding protein, HAAT family [uncultured delta proteobacterium]
MIPLRTTIRSRVFSGCLVLLCCLALSGCPGKTVIKGPGQTVPPARTDTAPPSGFGTADAEAALNAGQTARAEQLAVNLFRKEGMPPAEMARVARVLALAAAANGHPYMAINGLERWLESDPAADASPEWRDTFLIALGQLPQRDAITRAQGFMADTSRPFPLRAGSALFLASRQWERAAEAPQALANIQAFYSQTRDRNQRAHMEHALFSFLQNANDNALATLDGLVTEENSNAYPYAVVRLETLRRKALHATTREEAQAQAQALAQNTTLADPAILRSWDAAVTAPAITVPLSGRTLVLALPLSGSPGGIGKKIVQGAEEAKREFAAAGHTVNVVTLDTQDASWLDKLAAFPPEATVVGGPLRMDAFTAAHARGLTATRAFLTFLPSLGDAGEEGRIAWRFFPSPEDQFTALFAATSRVGVTEFAILMPDNDAYAARMADRFTAHVQAMGGHVVKRSEYPKNGQESWNKFIASFLGSSKHATRAPGVSHRAIFLPDSWRNMELIVPNLFYFLESRQMLLGTSLWEQGLAATDHVTAHYYNLAVFPGAWDKTATLSPAAARLQAAYARDGRSEPDFWAGLGYDFVRFASTLDIPVGWSPATVNAALSRNTDMAWSMAPLRWSGQGRANQSLFLFTPVTDGFAPADMNEIETRFNKVWNR